MKPIKTEPFVRYTADEVLKRWETGKIYKPAGYLLDLIRALRKDGWSLRFKVEEFCLRWKISRRAFFRAKAELIMFGLIEEKIHGELEIRINQTGDSFVTESDSFVTESDSFVTESDSFVTETKWNSAAEATFQTSPDLIQINYRSNTDLDQFNKEKSAFAQESFPQTKKEDFAKKPKPKPPDPKESDWMIFVEIYNALKLPLWAKCHSLNSERLKLLKRLVAEHGENTVSVFEKAFTFAKQDKWLQSVNWGFTNFVRHVTDLAEKAEVIGTEDDRWARFYDDLGIALEEAGYK